MLYSEISYIEVSDAINSTEKNNLKKKFPNEAMKNVHAKSDIKSIRKK